MAKQLLQTKKHKSEEKIDWFDIICRNAKHNFLENKRKFNRNPCQENRNIFLESRIQFCKAKRRAKSNYFKKEIRTLSNLSKKSPKQFWAKVNKFRKNRNYNSDPIDATQFSTHFANILNRPVSEENYKNNFTFERGRTVEIECLDKPFDQEEIEKCISSLSRNKSPGCDMITTIFFIDSKPFRAPFLVNIFNKFFQDGIYPTSWTKSIIVPIYKKLPALSSTRCPVLVTPI